MKNLYVLGIIFGLSVSTAWATHIVGGEFALQYKGRAFSYQLSLNLYFDDINGNPGAEDPSVQAAIFSKRTNKLVRVYVLPRVSYLQVDYTNPECTSARLKTRQIRYALDVTLDAETFSEPEGYYVVWERCCRNNAISNIVGPGDTGMSFYMEFPAMVQNGSRFANSSPIFTIPKGDYACVNEPFVFEFGATDPDGDQLRYSLVTPYRGYSSVMNPAPSMGQNPYHTPGPYPPATWASGISVANVIPGKDPLRVDPSTGQLTFTANRTGLYVFSVLCEELRNGVKIGEVRRDFQIMVIDCPKFSEPMLHLMNPNTGVFYREEQIVEIKHTGNRCFDVAIADSSLRESVILQLLPQNFPAEWASITPTRGTINGIADTLHAQICWSECTQNPPGQPLVFDLVVSDNSCPLPKRDTVRIRANFEPIPNNLPVVRTSLAGNRADVIAGNALEFTVTGLDSLDNDQISLTAIGRGFNLADKGMSFTNGTATGSITTPFVWKPDCNVISDGETYVVDFVVKDERCPENSLADTVSVTLQFTARESLPPDVVTTLENNRVEMEINQAIRFDVIATDPDRDAITLRAVGRGFNLEDVGMQFRNNQTGVGEIREPFVWTPTCDNTERDRGSYVVDFITEDNSCSPNRFDTVTVELDLANFEVTVDDFLPPNVFTPNADGKNDTFFIPNLPPDNCRDTFKFVEVYNRWGKLVFQSDSREFQWNGFGFPPGSYYYLLHYQHTTYKGAVSLLR